MTPPRIIYNEPIHESVRLHLLAADDPLIPDSTRFHMETRCLTHAIVLNIEAADPVVMESYKKLRSNHRMEQGEYLLGTQRQGDQLIAFLAPSQECIMALEETGMYEPGRSSSPRIRQKLAALLSESSLDVAVKPGRSY